jgi:hypothetical protein
MLPNQKSVQALSGHGVIEGVTEMVIDVVGVTEIVEVCVGVMEGVGVGVGVERKSAPSPLE